MAGEKDALLQATADARGFRYGLHDLLADVNPELLKKLNEWIDAIYLSPKYLDRKTKELIIVAVCCACHDEVSHLQMHIKAAADAGATKEEILEVINLQSMWAGAIGQMVGLEAWRRAFAPHLPTVLRQTL